MTQNEGYRVPSRLLIAKDLVSCPTGKLVANRIRKSDHSITLQALVPENSISNAALCPVTCSSGVSKEDFPISGPIIGCRRQDDQQGACSVPSRNHVEKYRCDVERD